MSDVTKIILGLLGPIALLALVAHVLQKRARTKGPLFTAPPSRSGRVIAFLLAIVFTLPTLFEIATFQTHLHVVFPILAVVLAAYALGADKLLRSIQEVTDVESHTNEHSDQE